MEDEESEGESRESNLMYERVKNQVNFASSGKFQCSARIEVSLRVYVYVCVCVCVNCVLFHARVQKEGKKTHFHSFKSENNQPHQVFFIHL